MTKLDIADNISFQMQFMNKYSGCLFWILSTVTKLTS